MPRRYKKKTRKVARRYRKRAVPRTIGVFANTATRKLTFHYSDLFDTSVAVPLKTAIFRANSLFDPVFALGGAQPRGFDQMSEYYSRYFVTNAKITVRALWQDPTSTRTPMNFGVSLRDSSTASALAVDYLEHPENGTSRFLASSSDRYVQASYTYNVRRFFDKTIDDSTLQGTPSTNPNEGAFFHVWAAPVYADGTTDPGKIVYEIDILYTAKFTDPVPVGQST